MSTCLICHEKFTFNEDIVACGQCKCLMHESCIREWIRMNNNEIKPCIHCQQYGTLYTDSYDIYYYQKRLRRFTSSVFNRIIGRS